MGNGLSQVAAYTTAIQHEINENVSTVSFCLSEMLPGTMLTVR